MMSYVVRISDWSSDVCSSDLAGLASPLHHAARGPPPRSGEDFGRPSQRPPRIIRGPPLRLAVDPRLAAALREIADARHVIGAFLHADHAARLQEVEAVARLARLVKIGRASCRESVCQYG